MQMMLQAGAKSSLFLPRFRTPLGAAARTEFVGGCKAARGAEPARGDSSTAKLHLAGQFSPSLGSVPSGPQSWKKLHMEKSFVPAALLGTAWAAQCVPTPHSPTVPAASAPGENPALPKGEHREREE